MSKTLQKQRGYTFIELAIGLSITIFLATVSVYVSGNVLRKNRLMNQLRVLKSTVLTARARAIEKTAPVLVRIDNADGSILVLLDKDRDGDFTDADTEIIIGGTDVDGDTTGVKKTFSNVEPFTLSTSSVPGGLPTLNHWSGISTPAHFPNSEFVLMPNGNVLETSNFTPSSGAFFYKTGSEDNAGAVFITSRGEVRTAYIAETGTDGVWNDWIWHQ